jgi:hypothetical protein
MNDLGHMSVDVSLGYFAVYKEFGLYKLLSDFCVIYIHVVILDCFKPCSCTVHVCFMKCTRRAAPRLGDHTWAYEIALGPM